MNYKYLNTPKTLPKIRFTLEAFTKLVTLINPKNTNSKEIAYFGLVDRDKTNFIVKDIVIPPQEANTSSWVETHDDMALWIAKQFTTIEERKSIRMHGHTHPKFGTSPSGTDQTLYDQLKEEISDYFIRIIMNEKFEFNLDIFDYKNNIEVLKAPMYVDLGEDFSMVSDGKGKYGIFMNPKSKAKPKLTDNNKYIEFPISKEASIIYDMFNNVSWLHTSQLDVINGVVTPTDQQLMEELGKDLKAKIKPSTKTVTQTRTSSSRAGSPSATTDYTKDGYIGKVPIFKKSDGDYRSYIAEVKGWVTKGRVDELKLNLEYKVPLTQAYNTRDGEFLKNAEEETDPKSQEEKGSENSASNQEKDLIKIAVDYLKDLGYDTFEEKGVWYYLDEQQVKTKVDARWWEEQ